MNDQFDMVAKTFQGLEGVLAEELRQLGAAEVKEGIRMVSFKGDKAMMYRANFCCRTAVRILKPFLQFNATDAESLYEKAKTFEWDKVMTADTTFSIDPTIYSDNFLHSRYVTYRVKDAIVDYFNERYGKRPTVLVSNPDMQLNVHIAGTHVTFSLDSSGESLHKRGYRVATTDAPINEVMAAGILRLAGWDGQCDLVDPMCGSGTFLVEAALIATNTAPGVYRTQGYAFEHWPDFDRELFEEIYNDDSAEREFTHKIYGSDMLRQAVDISLRNVKSAGMSRYVEVECKDFFDITNPPANAMLVTNPPYGERLSLEKIEEFYSNFGSQLKHTFTGYDAWIIGYKEEHFDMIGLRPSVKLPMLNGELECQLREFRIFSGKFDDMRREGGSIHNDEFRRPSRDRKPATARTDKPAAKGARKSDDKRGGTDGKRRYGAPKHDSKPGDERRSRFARDSRAKDAKPEAPHYEGIAPVTDEEKERNREILMLERRMRDHEKVRKAPIVDKAPQLSASTEIRLSGQRRNSWKKNK